MEHISPFKSTIMIVGTLIGAGFASGREMWSYYASFGVYGYFGLAIFVLLMIGVLEIGMNMSNKLKTKEFADVIVPGNSKALHLITKYYMAIVLWSCIIIMTAAGASVVNQEFGWPKIIGGVLVVILVLATVFGDFERVSGAFRFVMPVLVAVMIIASIIIITHPIPDQGCTNEITHPSMTPVWYLSAFIYCCFNVTGPLCMAIVIGYRCDNIKSARAGIYLTAVIIYLIGALIIAACSQQPSFTEAMDMPLLAYSAVISKPLNIIFSVLMMIAIYSSATSNFYTFSTEIPNGKHKKAILVIAAVIGYLIGLVGFKNIVNYMFSIWGYLGILFLGMMIFNYIKMKKEKRI